jgi:protein TonB
LALLASLALHLLVLYALPMLKEAARMALPPLTARLVKPKPPPEPPQVEPPPPQPHSVARAQRPSPVPAAPPAPVLAVESVPQAVESVPVVPAAPPQSASPPQAARPEPSPAAAAGPDPGSVARFRLELMDIARRYKRYPRIAQDNNWEGRVELRIAFAGSGAISSLVVKKSAGHAVLDEEAQAMIRRAQAQASVPPALRGKAFTLEIPVDFFLRDEGN